MIGSLLDQPSRVFCANESIRAFIDAVFLHAPPNRHRVAAQNRRESFQRHFGGQLYRRRLYQ